MPSRRPDIPGLPSAHSSTPTGGARPATPADAAAVESLLETAASPYSGPVDRSRIPRPPVPDDALRFVVERNGRIGGVATFSVSGGVLDWAVPAGPVSGETAAALLKAGEAWVEEQGGREVLLYLPRDDAPPPEMLTELGYRSVAPPYTVMQVVHFSNLLSAVAIERFDRLRGLAPITLAIHLEPGLYPPLDEPDLLVRVSAEAVTVAAGTDEAAGLRVSTTATRFSEFLFGARSTADFLAHEVRIEPPARSDAAATVLEALAFGRPWYVPLGERR